MSRFLQIFNVWMCLTLRLTKYENLEFIFSFSNCTLKYSEKNMKPMVKNAIINKSMYYCQSFWKDGKLVFFPSVFDIVINFGL